MVVALDHRVRHSLLRSLRKPAKSSLAVNNSSVAGSPVSRYRARSSVAAWHSLAVIRMSIRPHCLSPSASLTSTAEGRLGALTWCFDSDNPLTGGSRIPVLLYDTFVVLA